ncbi:MAG: hypothetical protein ACQESR_10310 [Planctomycetota bacterium]
MPSDCLARAETGGWTKWHAQGLGCDILAGGDTVWPSPSVSTRRRLQVAVPPSDALPGSPSIPTDGVDLAGMKVATPFRNRGKRRAAVTGLPPA